MRVPSFQSPEAWRALGAAAIQGVLVAGISEILRQPFLDSFPLGVYGFHASLFPALAGPAPVNWAIIRGLPETGTTLLRYTTGPGRRHRRGPGPLPHRSTRNTGHALPQALRALGGALAGTLAQDRPK